MSKPFAFSADAEPFVPEPLCEEKMKARLESRIQTLEAQLEEEKLSKMRLIKSYHAEITGIDRFSGKDFKNLEKENERLNKEIREGVTKLLYERDKVKEKDLLIQEKQGKISSLESSITSYQCRIVEFECINDNLKSKYEELEVEIWNIKKEQDELRENRNEGRGRCLRLDFIFKKMKHIGALPEDHGAWVWDMVDDIEFPNGTDHQSIYLSLPRYVRNQYLPSESDANIQFQEDENAVIEELSLEAQSFNQNLSEHFRNNLDENPEVVMNHIRTIQTRFREYIRPCREEQNKAAIKIQSAWRGLCGRGIITYKGRLFELVNQCKISLESAREFPPVGTSWPMRIMFANTSKETIHYQWIKINNYSELEGTGGRMYNIPPGRHIVVKAYYSHWFRICKEGECDRFFRIERSSFLGGLRTYETTIRPVVVDLNTRITLSHSDFKEWQDGFGGPGQPRFLDTNYLNVVGNDSVPNNIPDEDSSDDARLMLAIQLSLEQTSSLTSDVSDLEINSLFQ